MRWWTRKRGNWKRHLVYSESPSASPLIGIDRKVQSRMQSASGKSYPWSINKGSTLTMYPFVTLLANSVEQFDECRERADIRCLQTTDMRTCNSFAMIRMWTSINYNIHCLFSLVLMSRKLENLCFFFESRVNFDRRACSSRRDRAHRGIAIIIVIII